MRYLLWKTINNKSSFKHCLYIISNNIQCSCCKQFFFTTATATATSTSSSSSVFVMLCIHYHRQYTIIIMDTSFISMQFEFRIVLPLIFPSYSLSHSLNFSLVMLSSVFHIFHVFRYVYLSPTVICICTKIME